MINHLLSVKVDGGLTISVNENPVLVRAMTASLSGALHLRVAQQESLFFKRWLQEYAAARSNMLVGPPVWRKNIKVVLGSDTWEFENCCPTAISSSDLDVVLDFDLPRKNERTVHAKTDI